MTYIDVKPEVLKALRENIGVPKSVVASRFGISESTLDTWEARGQRISLSKLRNMEATFARNWMAFLLDVPPDPPNKPKDRRSRRESGKALTEGELRLLADVDRILTYAEQLGIGQGWMDFSGIDSSSIENAASDIRKKLGITLEEQFSWDNSRRAFKEWVNAFSNAGIYIVERTLKEASFRGAVYKLRNQLAILIDGADSPNGKSFSLMHELGHILFGQDAICDFHETGSRAVDQQEVECNALAAEILVPSQAFVEQEQFESVQGGLDVRRVLHALANRFKVSRDVVLRRFETLGAISNEKYRIVQDELEEEYANRSRRQGFGISTYAERMIKRNSRAYTAEVIRAFRENKLSYADMGAYLDVTPQHIRSIMEGM